MPFKYNWEIIGHDNNIIQLESDLMNNNISHAYLFSGPANVGKGTLAKKFAYILQCEYGFCNNCVVCTEIRKGCHGDTIEVPDNGESIKIEQIRGIIEKLNMSRQSRYKILILEGLERMTLESSNALLKTLEDPPENVIFLLTANQIKEVLPTILSRVRLLQFNRLTEADIVSVLRKLFPDASGESIDSAGSFSFGSPGRAISYLQNPDCFALHKKIYDNLSGLFENPDRAAKFVYIGNIVNVVKETKNNKLLSDVLDIFIIVLKNKLDACIDNNDSHGSKRVANLVKKVQESRQLLKRNVNNRLLLENLILEI